MSSIKDQIITLVKQRHHSHKVALEQEKDPRSKHAIDLIARIREDSRLIEVIDSLPDNDSLDESKIASKDLEEAASRGGFDYVDKIVHESPGHRWNDHDVEFGYRDGFIAGAGWQRETMIKGEVEGEIWKAINRYELEKKLNHEEGD